MKNTDFSNNSFECKEANAESAILNEELNELTIFDTDKNQYYDGFDFEGNYTLNTTYKNTVFIGEDAESAAIDQSKALSSYYAGSGCFKVYKESEVKFIVTFDECPVRDGVEDNAISQSNQHSNSGTYEWSEATKFNAMD